MNGMLFGAVAGYLNANYIASWDGHQWSTLGTPGWNQNGLDSYGNALVMFQNKLYI